MKHHLLVLHFGAQCPWYRWVIDQANQAAQELGTEVAVKDVMDHPELAEKHRMFSPFMTIIDGNIRIPGPMGTEALIRMVKENPERNPTSPMAHGERTGPHSIHGLTPDNVKATIPLCIADVRPTADREKALWAEEMCRRSGCSLLGFIAFQGDKAKGVVQKTAQGTCDDSVGKHGHAILHPLAIAHDDEGLGEVHILDVQPHALHQPQATAVKQASHQTMCAR